MSFKHWTRFEYERSLKVYRPLVPINLKYWRRQNDRIGSLIDSGAQDTIFDVAIATDLNVPLVQGNTVEIEMGGKRFIAYKSHVQLQVEGIPRFVKVEVCFAKELPYPGILGDKFFQNFFVRFERNNGSFYVMRNPILEFSRERVK